MNNYLLKLVAKMSGKDILATSDTILADENVKQAYEEARNINDPSFSEELISYISSETDDEKRNHLYFIFSNLIRNAKLLNCLQFLIDRLLLEKKVDILVTILSTLEDIFKPLTIDITPIFKCTDSKSWHVRGKAYLALTNTANNVEEFLSGKLQNIFIVDDQLYLLFALRYVGKDLSIPVVESFVKSRKPSIKNAASYTLAVILLRQGYNLSEISKKTKLSIEGLERLRNKINELTRPG